MIEVAGYKIDNLIGRGGMSEIYRARKLDEGIDVALKIISSAMVNDADFQQRFNKEMRVIRKMNHPNIVKYFDSGMTGNQFYIALEYLPGPDLKKRIKKGQVSIQKIVKWLNQIALGLDYVHKKGFLHRDIKPENILLRADDTAVITDFGIAKAINSSTKLTGTGMSIGTPYYMSPEQAKGLMLDYRTDIYSLGVMLYELLMGAVPYDGEDSIAIGIKHLSEPVPKLSSYFVYWQPILDKMMAKDRNERYEKLVDFLKDLKELKSSGQLIVKGTQEQRRLIQKKVQKEIKQTTEIKAKPKEPLFTLEEARNQLTQVISSADLERRIVTRTQIIQDNRATYPRQSRQTNKLSLFLLAILLVVMSAFGWIGYKFFLNETSFLEELVSPTHDDFEEPNQKEEPKVQPKPKIKPKDQAESKPSKKITSETKREIKAREKAEAKRKAKAEQERKAEQAKKIEQNRRQAQAKKAAQAKKPTNVAAQLSQVCTRSNKTAQRILREIERGMLSVPRGSFQSESAGKSVRIKSFKIAQFELTGEHFQCYANLNKKNYRIPSGWKQDTPAVKVSHRDAKQFISWLNRLAKAGEKRGNYRLPSEMEWEYVATGRGSIDRESFLDRSPFICSVSGCSGALFWNKRSPLGVAESRKSYIVNNASDSSNPIHIGNGKFVYHMIGNVLEWTEDCWVKSASRLSSNGTPYVQNACRQYAVRGSSAWDAGISTFPEARMPYGAETKILGLGFRLAQD